MTKTSITLIGLVTMSITSVRAEEVFRSQCGPVTREAAVAINQLSPWFDHINQQIIKQPAYDKVRAALARRLERDSVVCFFKLSSLGAINDAVVAKSSGSETLDQSMLTLIREASPFEAPPNDLPKERGIMITFTAKDQQISLSSELGRLINARIGDSAQQR